MNEIAFPEKRLQGDMQCSKLEIFPRVANPSLRKFFRLVLIEKVHQGLKKMNNIAFPSLQGDMQCSKLEIILRVANTSLGQIFRLVLIQKVHQGLKKKLVTISLFRKIPYRPTYRTGNTKKNSQGRQYFARKFFSTGTCRNGPIRLRKKLETKSLFRKSPFRPIYRTPRVVNTSLGKIFRLALVKKIPQGLKKIMNDIAFPEKPLQADIQCSKLEKNFPETQILR